MQAMLSVHSLPILGDNYVWILVQDQQAVIVDPGDADPVLGFVARQGLSVAAVLITHHHADHTGGLAKTAAAFEGAPVYGPAAERISGVTHPVEAEDTLRIARFPGSFRVIPVPGHTSGHIAYLWTPPEEGEPPVLLAGDSLFAGGCGRVFEGTPEQMHASLQRLAQLPGETRVCCGHEYTVANLEFAVRVEPRNDTLRERLEWARRERREGRPTVPSTMEQEWATNPFLRTGNPDVRAQAEARAGGPLESEAAVFAVIRAWKDRGD